MATGVSTLEGQPAAARVSRREKPEFHQQNAPFGQFHSDHTPRARYKQGRDPKMINLIKAQSSKHGVTVKIAKKNLAVNLQIRSACE
jgi:hypothetical protein